MDYCNTSSKDKVKDNLFFGDNELRDNCSDTASNNLDQISIEFGHSLDSGNIVNLSLLDVSSKNSYIPSYKYKLSKEEQECLFSEKDESIKNSSSSENKDFNNVKIKKSESKIKKEVPQDLLSKRSKKEWPDKYIYDKYMSEKGIKKINSDGDMSLCNASISEYSEESYEKQDKNGKDITVSTHVTIFNYSTTIMKNKVEEKDKKRDLFLLNKLLINMGCSNLYFNPVLINEITVNSKIIPISSNVLYLEEDPNNKKMSMFSDYSLLYKPTSLRSINEKNYYELNLENKDLKKTGADYIEYIEYAVDYYNSQTHKDAKLASETLEILVENMKQKNYPSHLTEKISWIKRLDKKTKRYIRSQLWTNETIHIDHINNIESVIQINVGFKCLEFIGIENHREMKEKKQTDLILNVLRNGATTNPIKFMNNRYNDSKGVSKMIEELDIQFPDKIYSEDFYFKKKNKHVPIIGWKYVEKWTQNMMEFHTLYRIYFEIPKIDRRNKNV